MCKGTAYPIVQTVGFTFCKNKAFTLKYSLQDFSNCTICSSVILTLLWLDFGFVYKFSQGGLKLLPRFLVCNKRSGLCSGFQFLLRQLLCVLFYSFCFFNSSCLRPSSTAKWPSYHQYPPPKVAIFLMLTLANVEKNVAALLSSPSIQARHF